MVVGDRRKRGVGSAATGTQGSAVSASEISLDASAGVNVSNEVETSKNKAGVGMYKLAITGAGVGMAGSTGIDAGMTSSTGIGAGMAGSASAGIGMADSTGAAIGALKISKDLRASCAEVCPLQRCL